ncbi:hypothetical protein [Spongiivirga citrea]|uniref:Uncharacterized protein n=1 Tax=Spongiivirga citrea TaxID=1481457 RepID=A0A6M0CMG1_9FLAO|nr:hypothetical protein [Spongiivirga citrea]NER16647.1 hypothetical protein [Spongiivirga citrea]
MKLGTQRLLLFLILFSFVSTLSCHDTDNNSLVADEAVEETTTLGGEAEVTEVTFTKNENDYTFSVRIKSPDTGCEQYANWWEIITEDGDLVYRRILGHSHVTEQPFTRSGGPVSVTEDQILIIRGHMNNSGYGTTIFKGTIKDGFEKTIIDNDFAKDLEEQQPLPSGCAF